MKIYQNAGLPFGLLLVVGCSGMGNNTAPPPATATTTPNGSGSNTTPSGVPDTLSVVPTAVAVYGSTQGTAPVATLSAIPSSIPAGATVYIHVSYTTTGISTATMTSNNGIALISLAFRSPSSLGAGTYNDLVTVGVFQDEAATYPIANSPITVPVTYSVTASGTYAQVLPSAADLAPAAGRGGARLALAANGTVWALPEGSGGDGITTPGPGAVQVRGLDGIVALAAGVPWNLAVTGRGAVWAWGVNALEAFPTGAGLQQVVPVQVSRR